MNRTALALLQGRLWRAAVFFDERLHPVDAADTATHAKARPHDNEEVAVPQNGHLEAELSAVLRALERIDKGSYGLCETCGRAIDPDQLFARPQQLACGECECAEPSAAATLDALQPTTGGQMRRAPASFVSLLHENRLGRTDDARSHGDGLHES